MTKPHHNHTQHTSWVETHIHSCIIHVWTSLTDKGIGSLGRIVRKLEELCLVRLKKVKGEGLKGLMSRSLKQLTLQEIYEVTDSSVCALVRNCPNVEKLTLVDLDRVSDASFVCLAEVLREKLVSLNVCVRVGVRVGVWYL